jgi:L-alanine-DL-glutamate epimerase-like enolase superfamily enzyme
MTFPTSVERRLRDFFGNAMLHTPRVGHHGITKRLGQVDTPIKRLQVSAYLIPTDGRESDGTLQWDHTILVLVQAEAGGKRGLGYTYAGLGAAHLIREVLAEAVEGHDALAVTECWLSMTEAVRNLGRLGPAAMGISAVDVALWDLKAKLLNLSLVQLLGMVRDRVMIYGSGGFTSYSLERLEDQLAGWIEEGLSAVKMKVGRHPTDDIDRVRHARSAIGNCAALFVDANGAYDRKQALKQADIFATSGVTWFEEPVSSDDLEGLRLVRDRAPAGMDIAAGEYGYDGFYFRRMLSAGAVDVLQADATRCAGITGFMQTAVLCQAEPLAFSAHCAPALHLHPCCAAIPVRHLEYFYDHVRIERLFFDGVVAPKGGTLSPDLSRPGIGLEFKPQDARRYEV